MTKGERVSGNTLRLRKLAAEVARRILRDRRDVLAIGVCGSVARGEAGPGSDLDMQVIVRTGPGKHTSVVLGRTFISLSFRPLREVERDFTQASAYLAHQRGGLQVRVVHDPLGLFPKLRAKATRLPGTVWDESARDALAEMSEYMGKLRNARARRDHANLVYAAWIVGVHAINLVGNMNRRDYASENTMWSEWRDFPSLPPRFGERVDVACGFRRASDRQLAATTEALWASCRRWATARGIRLRTIRSLRSLPISGRKTT